MNAWAKKFTASPPLPNTGSATMQALEAQAIRNCLAKAKNKSRAARQLGISRSTLYRKMKEYGLAD